MNRWNVIQGLSGRQAAVVRRERCAFDRESADAVARAMEISPQLMGLCLRRHLEAQFSARFLLCTQGFSWVERLILHSWQRSGRHLFLSRRWLSPWARHRWQLALSYDAALRGYRDHLASDDWRRLKKRLLLERGARCEHCGVLPRRLDLHHKTYERLGCESDDDLELLCRACHDEADAERKSCNDA